MNNKQAFVNNLDTESLLALVEMINQTPICLCLLAKDDRILQINQSGTKLFGSNSKMELEGQDFKTLISNQHLHKFENLKLQAEKENKSASVLKIDCKDGSHKWMEAFCTQQPTDKQTKILLMHDVDEKIKVKEELAKNKEALIEAERLSALGEFSAGIAHEINNPLTIIKTQTSLLLTKQEMPNPINQEELASALRRINQTVDRTNKIIENLRKFSRGQQLNTPLKRIRVNNVLNDTLSICKEKFNQAGIDIYNQLHPRHEGYCRKVGLAQVFMNLLNNSFDALKKLDEKWIKIESRSDEKKLRISFTDSGKGIDPKVAKKLMEPFYTTKEVGKGTGLGLSISSTIMESFKGRIFLNQSAANTQFILELNH